jgi:hypothetical protein
MNAENFLTTYIIIDFEIKGTKEPISYVPFRLDFRLTCNSEIFHIQVTLLHSKNMVIVESSRHWATATHQHLATDCAVSSSSVATQRSVYFDGPWAVLCPSTRRTWLHVMSRRMIHWLAGYYVITVLLSAYKLAWYTDICFYEAAVSPSSLQ